jgi:3-dehydroquinate synthase
VASLGARPAITDLSSADLIASMKRDKKVVAGTLHFVLPTSIGSTSIVDDVTADELRSSLQAVGFAA